MGYAISRVPNSDNWLIFMARKNTTARAPKRSTPTRCGAGATSSARRRSWRRSTPPSVSTGGSTRRTSRARSPTATCWSPRASSRPRTAAPSSAGSPRCARRSRSGRFKFSTKLEDIHFNVEGRLTDLDRAGRRAPAHGALAQRPDRARRAAVGARHDRSPGADARRPAGRADRSRRRICRDHHAGLHPSADGAAHHLRPSPDGLCRDVRPRPQPPRPTAVRG